jgi:endonuclease YncB( thermonuclease family)
MLRLRFLFLLLLFAPAFAHAEDAPFTVAQVLSGKSFVLTSGDVVRLAGIETPNAEEGGRPGEPLGEEAKAALSSLIAHQKIRMEYDPGTRDRYNRLSAEAYLMDGTWVEGYLLRHGFAMVYSFSGDAQNDIPQMLAAEREAQAEKLGVWAHPYWRVVTPEETPEFINRFKIVEGTIASVNPWHGNIYVNFNKHWKGNFAVFISRKYAGAFSPEKLQALVGRKVRVRGWIHYHNAPMIDITRPEQIEAE